MASSAAIPDLDRLRPAGTKRSSKRDLIVNVFLKQEGHLSADDLVALIKREDQRISRATVYRTLQWMEEAGIARKVDFGEGRFRFEHSYRHPRHFHLICKTCNRSYEFLSSDIEALVEEVAAARAFTARQSVVQIYGTCESCSTGRAPPTRPSTRSCCSRATRLRIAIATERSGMEFYGRGVKLVKDPRAREIFRKLATEEVHHLKTLENRYQELLKQDPQLESRPTFLFFKGAANGLFSRGHRAAAPRRRRRSRGLPHRHPLRARLASLLQALRRAVRGFGRQAHLPGVCRRRARASRAADPRVPRAREAPSRRRGQATAEAVALQTPEARGGLGPIVVDRPPHAHDRVGRAAVAGRAGRARRGGGPDHDQRHRSRHRRGDRRGHGGGARRRHPRDARHRDHRDRRRPRRAHAGLLLRSGEPATGGAAREPARPARRRACARSPARLASLNMPRGRRQGAAASAAARPGSSVGRPQLARELVRAGHVESVQQAFDRWLATGRPAFVPRTGRVRPTVIETIHAAGGVASFAHPGVTKRDELIAPLVDRGLDAIEVYHSDHTPRT